MAQNRNPYALHNRISKSVTSWRLLACLSGQTPTLDSGINVGPMFINFGHFPGPRAFIKRPYVYFLPYVYFRV